MTYNYVPGKPTLRNLPEDDLFAIQNRVDAVLDDLQEHRIDLLEKQINALFKIVFLLWISNLVIGLPVLFLLWRTIISFK